MPVESLLRPPIELWSAGVALVAAATLAIAPNALMIPASVARICGAGLAALGVTRLLQGARVLRYQRGFRHRRILNLSARVIPTQRAAVYVGSGFHWTQQHTQRLRDAFRPQAQRFVQGSVRGEAIRRWLAVLGPAAIRRWLSSRALPAGQGALHAVGMQEQSVWMDRAARVGHCLVLGTTRVGKTRLAELLITQDIRFGDTVIVFDPKGDPDLLTRLHVEAKAAGRDFYLFHLGHPAHSARYNAIGNFSRITEVATRIANQLPTEGNSMAFREFAWRFVNIIARALVALNRRPDYHQIRRYINDIDPLFVEYANSLLATKGPVDWASEVAKKATRIKKPRRGVEETERAGRAELTLALIQYLDSIDLYDPVLDGLLSAVKYDRTYFDKIVSSVGPLMDKLTTGPAAELISPDYFDEKDPRPIFEWLDVIERRAVVYVGLDALSDMTVAAAVGNSMFADLVSVAGHLYKRNASGHPPAAKISVHADEFNELVGDEFVPLLNKAGGAGFQITAYTQTWSDVEARFGSRAKAGQVAGNFNSMIMLRVKDLDTASLLTDQLPVVDVVALMSVSGVDDSSEPESGVDFRSRNEDRISLSEVPLLTPAELVALPKGEAFALLEGGALWKLRLPLLTPATKAPLAEVLDDIRRSAPSPSATTQSWFREFESPTSADP